MPANTRNGPPGLRLGAEDPDRRSPVAPARGSQREPHARILETHQPAASNESPMVAGLTSSRPREFAVLVADQSILVRSALRSMLDEDAELFLAGEALSGAEAMEQAFRLRPAAVLLAVNLPDHNGFEVAQRIKRTVPDCIVVLLAGITDPCVEEAAKVFGADAVCARTGDPDGIRDTLRRLTQFVESRSASAGR